MEELKMIHKKSVVHAFKASGNVALSAKGTMSNFEQ